MTGESPSDDAGGRRRAADGDEGDSERDERRDSVDGNDSGFRWVTDPVSRAPEASRADDGTEDNDTDGTVPGVVRGSGETDESVESEEGAVSDGAADVQVGLDGVASEPLGGWDAVPDDPPESADGAEADDGAGAARSNTAVADATLPAPPRAWRDGDPTGAAWWRVLTRATQLSVVVLLLWSVPFAVVDLTVASAPGSLPTLTAVGVGGLAVVAGVLRFVVLPAALYRDATLVGRADAVAWTPRRREFLAAVAVSATPTCLYYLYLRGRHVGNPRVPLRPSVLRYEGQRVASNWWLAVGIAVVVGTTAGGVATALSELSAPTALARTALGGPFLTLAGAEAFVTTTTALPRPVNVAVGAPALALGGLAAFLRLVVLPVAFYADATAVRRSDAPWEPLALWYTAAGWVLAVPTGLFYLARRRARTGVSLPPDREGGSPDREGGPPGHERAGGGE